MPFSERFARRIVAGRWYLLLFALLLFAVCVVLGQRLTFERSVESMYAPDNEQLVRYQRLKEIFGGGQFVLVAYRDPDFFSEDGSGLKKLEERSRKLADIEGIAGVLSLAEINAALEKVYSLGNLINLDSAAAPITNPDDELAKEFLEIFEGYTHRQSDDSFYLAIVCLMSESKPEDQDHTSDVVAEMREVIQDWPNARITGEPVLVSDGFRFINRDGNLLNRNCMILMAIVIIGCFRSLRWMLIPLAVIQMSLWITYTVLVLVGWRLTMVSSMLSAIVTVIAVATTIHVTVRFREARQKNRSRETSMVYALSVLSIPIAWACITDAVGFLSLATSQVEPVRDFGWMMAIASLAVLLSIFLIVPGLALLGKWDADPKTAWGERLLKNVLNQSSRVISRRAHVLGALSVAGLLFVASGVLFLKVETEFTNNFRRDSEIIQAYIFVENKLGGAGIVDVVIPCPANMNREYIERVEELQNDLRKLEVRENGSARPALTKVLSYADADRAISSNPVLRIITPEIRFKAMSEVMPTFAGQLKTVAPDDDGNHWFRVMLRTSQQRSATDQAALIKSIEETVEEHFPKSQKPAPITTGFFVLLSDLVNSVLEDQVKTFAIATMLIGLVMLVAHRSWRLAIIALIPNVIPIVALLGILGWLGIKLNMGSAMIAAVSIGLSIDGTIHYLTFYRLNRKAGRDKATAIELVQQRVGRAVVYSTIALVVGFGSLCISEFIPTVFFGALVGLSMLGGLFGNLVLLPVLLTVFDKADNNGKDTAASMAEDSPLEPVGMERFPADQTG